ncbi:unnamed protein product [Haemonchus placei]|uniref:Sema domain-containing protein n=1 Tax=Haemonchus placei TaxID=6290 RepID=A0A0N4X1K4_HAEPC|nr:unnamed protein product [Haemonchus placei]
MLPKLGNRTGRLRFANDDSLVLLHNYGPYVLLGGRNAVFNVSITPLSLIFKYEWPTSENDMTECTKKTTSLKCRFQCEYHTTIFDLQIRMAYIGKRHDGMHEKDHIIGACLSRQLRQPPSKNLGNLRIFQHLCDNYVRTFYSTHAGFVVCGTHGLNPTCANFAERDRRARQTFAGDGLAPHAPDVVAPFLFSGRYLYTANG